jgi:aspyridone synthetase trans-acting enoyl reductase
VALEKFPNSVTSTRRAVRASWAMGPIMFGRRITMGDYSFDPDPEAREFGRRWYALVESLLFNEKIRSHPVRIIDEDGAWTQSVLRGLQYLQEKSVSGQKLIVNIEQ